MAKQNNTDITPEEVHKIASLARLNLEGDELNKLTHDFNQILHFVHQIDEVDTGDTAPMGHVLGLQNSSREDQPVDSLQRQDLEQIAPEFSAGYFVVPRVIEGN